jgi:hypothetical protein
MAATLHRSQSKALNQHPQFNGRLPLPIVIGEWLISINRRVGVGCSRSRDQEAAVQEDLWLSGR